jgi:hypothetical protein
MGLFTCSWRRLTTVDMSYVFKKNPSHLKSSPVTHKEMAVSGEITNKMQPCIRIYYSPESYYNARIHEY